MFRVALVTVLAIASVCGCAGSREPTSPGRDASVQDGGLSPIVDGGSDVVIVPGDTSLFATAASERSMLGSRSLGGRRFFVVVDVTLHNGETSALVFSFATFRVVVAGLEIVAAAETASLPNACPSSGFLSAGGTTSCGVAFDVSEVPQRLVFASVFESAAQPVRLEVAFPTLTRCERCGGSQCVDLQSSERHCGACAVEVPDRAECVGGTIVCEGERVLYCDDQCRHIDAIEDVGACAGVNVVERESRDRCDGVCPAGTCLGGIAYYGFFGDRRSLDCDEVPPPTVTSVPSGLEQSFNVLDCVCTEE